MFQAVFGHKKALVILIGIVHGGSYGLEGGAILDLRGAQRHLETVFSPEKLRQNGSYLF